jgi:diguanylate cyclase (GGDEF)-like protein
MRLLQHEYIDSLSARLAQIDVDIEHVASSSDLQTDLQDLFRQVHSLTGSAGTFGFNRLSMQTRQLELKIRALIKVRRIPGAQAICDLHCRLDLLRQLVAQGPDDILSSPLQSTLDSKQNSNEKRLVYVVEEDASQSEEIVTQLDQFGYEVRIFLDVSQAWEAIRQSRPDALVIDIGLSEESMVFSRNLSADALPVIFISARSDWETRLASVRAGGWAYLAKPLNIALLVDQLDHLTRRDQQAPYRVLIVEDVIQLAEHYSNVLNESNIHVQTLIEPEKILNVLAEFKPELILMDLYMPQVTGIEVAQVIRQHHKLFCTPIVFLSVEDDRDTQLIALSQGDDFLQKPIQDDHLVRAVVLRAERARTLGTLMYHDGLTGLLNHKTLKLQLESELIRAHRLDLPMSFILLDIDHFKHINDRFGHPVGDRILKMLARLLKDRLRKSDHIGRYGGEEFGIILPDNKSDAARAVIESLREHFSQIVHCAHNTEFNCTFSAGIACFSQGSTDIKQLIEAADQALYKAKHGGRNCVAVQGDRL